MVQRLLAARNIRDSRKALFASWAVIAVLFALFLTIGVILWTLYQTNHMAVPAKLDRIYPQFIWDHLPVGIAGLVIAAVLAAAMSNLSAALNSLSSTTVMDFYRGPAPKRSEEHYLSVARFATIGWGVLLYGIGVVAQRVDSVLEAGLGIASILYGGLLGAFLLGVLTKRVTQGSAMVGMAAGVLGSLTVRFAGYLNGLSLAQWYNPLAWLALPMKPLLAPLAEHPVAFTWYVLIGTSVTISVSLAVALLRGEFRDTYDA